MKNGAAGQDFSWDRFSHLTGQEIFQLAARRLSDYNAAREGIASEPLHFPKLFPPLTSSQMRPSGGDNGTALRAVGTFVASAEPDTRAPDFLRRILTSTLSPSILIDSFREAPNYEAAIIVSWFLIFGGRTDRDMVLEIFPEFAKSDRGSSAPSAHFWMLTVLENVLGHAPDSERMNWIEQLGHMLRQGNQTLFRGIHFILNENCKNTDADYRYCTGLIDALLASKLPEGYCSVLACASSSTVASRVQTYALTRLVEDPCSGTPALNSFLRCCLMEPDPGEGLRRLRLVAASGGFLTEYWGPLALWAFERPLRLAALRGDDVEKTCRDVCPEMSPKTYLFAYNFADGRQDVLRCFERLFGARELNELQSRWDARQLRHALIRGAFSAPFAQLECQESILKIDPANEHARQLILNAIGNAALRQCEDLPALLAQRLIEFSGANFDDKSGLIASLSRTPSSGLSSREARRFMSVDPALTAQEQVDAFGTLTPGIQNWSEDVSWYKDHIALGDKAEKRWFCASPTRPSSLRQFVRAQTVTTPQAPRLLAALSEAFAQTIPTGELGRWVEWRYNLENPEIARQLRSLSPRARADWALSSYCIFEGAPVGGAIAVPELQGRAKYLVMEVDDPLWLFNLGVLPEVSAACTAFDGGAYYSGNLVSYVIDAHIKGLVVLDYTKILRQVSPLMSQVDRERIEAGQLSNSALRVYFNHLATTVVARSVLKLVEGEDTNPLLMMEPTFINGFFKKRDPTPELVTFGKVLARKYHAGLCATPYADESEFPTKAVVAPPSRSPGGQIENHDLMPWLGSHHGATMFNAILLIPPPQQHNGHPFWRGLV